ncbi:unnamed protein product [Adineta steineri]|uniref:Major royal jelly protein n=1 Tax=Adineta steineri TaxID=433720 RepID=A0A815J8H7_9BILA|nr:unnamed protein product [Adineta steineri]
MIIIHLFYVLLIFRTIFGDNRLIEVAQSPDYQWNGVALTKTNRIFAAFPRATGAVTLSVAEILSKNILKPYPGGDWNTFNPTTSYDNPDKRFVNINAILTDTQNNLWVVDSGMVGNKTYVNGSKLIKINLTTNKVERIYSTSSLNAPPGFALNGVRIGSQYAFLTESGLGSVVIIDLESGQVRRVLDQHPSTKFAYPTVVRMDGRVILDTNDESMNETQLGEKVSTSWKTMPTGGTTMDDQGFIYLIDLERQAIWQQSILDGSWKLIVRDERIVWGDASDVSQDGYLYVPMSQNNNIPSFNNGTNQVIKPFKMYKIKINSA